MAVVGCVPKLRISFRDVNIVSHTTQQGHNNGGVPFTDNDFNVDESVRKLVPNESIGKYTLQQLVHTDRLQCRQWIHLAAVAFDSSVDNGVWDTNNADGSNNCDMDVAVGRTAMVC